jgi:hypothetical protein
MNNASAHFTAQMLLLFETLLIGLLQCGDKQLSNRVTQVLVRLATERSLEPQHA